MSYQPYNRNAKSLVYFGDAGADAVFQSDSDLKFDDSTNKLIIPNNGYIGSVGDDDAIQIDGSGNVSFSQNITVQGDFTINGTTTTVNTTNLAVTDSLIELSQGASSATNDAGFIIERGSTGNNAVFVWDESEDRFTLGTTTATADSTGDLTISVGSLAANIVGDVTGDITGNAGTATALETARNFSLTGQVTAGSVSFDGQGNVALSTSLAATAITGQTTVTVAPDDSYVLIASGSALQKITKSNFVSDLGAMSSFTFSGTTGSSTIVNGDTLSVVSSSAGMVSTSVSADTLEISLTSAAANGAKNIEFDSSNGFGIADAGLNSIAGLTTAANKMIYTTASDTYAVTDLSAFGRSLIDDADASAARTTLGVVIGTNVQAYDAGLASIAGLTTAANKMIYTTGSDTYAVTDLSAFGRSLIDDADAATARGTLGVDAAGTDNSTDVTLNAAVTDVLSLSTQEISAVDNGSDAVVGWDDSAGALTYLSAADARAALNVDVAGTDNSTDVTLAGSYDYLTLSSQTITLGQIDLTTDVTGTLPVANGGTGATSLDDIVSANTKLSVTGGVDTVIGGNVTLTINEGNIVHDNLSGFVGNEHIDHSTVSISAGNGLTGGGDLTTTRTLTVGAGTGITVGATTVGISNGGVGTTQLADDSVTEAKRNRSVATTSSTGNISTDIVLGTSGAGGITLTLPTTSLNDGQMVIVKKIDSGAGALTIAGPTNAVDGASSKALYHQYETMTLVYSTTNSAWYIV